MSTNIKVCVRVRPENVRERESAQKPVVAVLDESMLIFDPVYDESGRFHLSPLFRCEQLPNELFDCDQT